MTQAACVHSRLGTEAGERVADLADARGPLPH